MDSISRLLSATHPRSVVEAAKDIRMQSLLLIITSALGVLISIINLSASPFENIIAGVFFLFSSLLGVPVGVYGYHTSRKVKNPYVYRYKCLFLVYAVVYLLFLVCSLVLEFITIIGEDDDSVEQILIGVGFIIMLLAMIPTCIWCIRGGLKLNRLVTKFEKDPTAKASEIESEY